MTNHPNQPDRSYRNPGIALGDVEIAAVESFAKAQFEGNKSMAARYMIRHFATCQFPLLGIEPQPDPEPAR